MATCDCYQLFTILYMFTIVQALKELPDKIRKVLEVDAKVLKVAQVSLCLCLYDLPDDDGYDDGIIMIVIIAIGDPQPCFLASVIPLITMVLMF